MLGTVPDTRPLVLYVEDEVALHRLIGFWLEDAGFAVEVALDGAEALRAIDRHRPDLVITDAMMPVMTGDELVETMKSDPSLDDIPVIMATAAASPFRTERMLARGCVAVLAKPLDQDSFVAAARAALAD